MSRISKRDHSRAFPIAIVCAAMVFALAGALDTAPESPMIWLQYPLFASLAWGLAKMRGTGDWRPAGTAAYIALSWSLGMAVELTLTVDGTGIGGVHRDTAASFILAQGDYLPLAAVFCLVHRYMTCGVVQVLWLAAGAALTEGLVFTDSLRAPVLALDIVAAVFTGAYLGAIYWIYLALPLGILGVPWAGRKRNVLVLLATGFAAAFAVRVFWGLVYAPAVSALFGLAPQ
ncbi:hypothetical protein KUH32_02870 [Thalassococcus sp. CAU 1522]|uniref:Uncharacterized protein n=1 Tax=Thalassococcus arenae TaxID=2851652 RepID=A0ABS6N3U8_9RHOB|nr:hypothetical protein [Thalassococcus arenae]MBV2358702.1 hypothetical protein [Thalassococcus arenae]